MILPKKLTSWSCKKNVVYVKIIDEKWVGEICSSFPETLLLIESFKINEPLISHPNLNLEKKNENCNASIERKWTILFIQM